MATLKPHELQFTRAVDPNAIAIFLNYQLQSQGMTARVLLKQNCLQILLEASQVPPQQASVAWVRRTMTGLKISVVESVKIYGRIRGKQTPSWSQQFSYLSDLHQKRIVPKNSDDSGWLSFVRSKEVAALFDRASIAKQNSTLQPHKKMLSVWAIGMFTLLSLGGFLIWNGTDGKFSPSFLATFSNLSGINQFGNNQFRSTSTPVASPTSAAVAASGFNFQEAIRRATQAATRTQTAKNREDWQQVSGLWQEAIVRLETVVPIDKNYALAQQKIAEYRRNFVYAQQRFQSLPNPTTLGITRQSIQSLFGDEFSDRKTGFQFSNAAAIDGQPRVMGSSANGLAMLELVGNSADLTKVTIVIGLPSEDASARALNRIYMLRLLQHLIPEWHDAANWLSESTTQLFDGYTGDVITIRNHKRVKLSAIGGVGTVVLVVEPN